MWDEVVRVGIMLLFGACVVTGLVCVDSRRTNPVVFLIIAALAFIVAMTLAYDYVNLMRE